MDENNAQFITQIVENMSKNMEDTLRDINISLQQIVDGHGGIKFSQTALKEMARTQRQENEQASRRYYSGAQGGDGPGARYTGYRRTGSSNANDIRKKSTDVLGDMLDSFEKEFNKSVIGIDGEFKDILNEPIRKLADKMGVSTAELGNEFGKRLGKAASDAFKGNPIGKRLSEEWTSAGKFFTDSVSDMITNAGDALSNPEGFSVKDLLKSSKDTLKNNYTKNFSNFETSISDVLDYASNRFTRAKDIAESKNAPKALTKVLGKGADLSDGAKGLLDMAKNGASASEMIAKVGESSKLAGKALSFAQKGATAIGTKFPAVASMANSVTSGLGGIVASGAALPALTAGVAVGLGAFVVALKLGSAILKKFKEAFEPAIKGFKSFGGSISNAANRDVNMRTKLAELEKKRIQDNTETLRKASMALIQDSAKKIEEVWDSILTTVSATQQLDKAGVQDLWNQYANRLKQDNLASVVSSADIMEKLQSILQQGLSGAVAEEFAYQATLLNSAVPTEDFFQYASTYAAIAANAIKNGADQQEALKLANSELAAFADNVLYASRELAGGFTTTLVNASGLFESATKIAMTSRRGDLSNISGVLTSVSAAVGAIAPDLASSLVDAVVNAAIGGNSSELTALRSLAGVGASNTAFLNALAEDPQKVFQTLFTNLASLQNWGSANYMEVAEALSSVFGISMDAFSRVDFQYLADAINSMSLNSGELQENLDALISGQTLSTESQLRMQKINEYMIQEGLAYVLDNEVARTIQEHMWEEQLAKEIEETTFAVDLQGGAIDLLTGLRNTVALISNIINPVSWVKKVVNVAFTAVEAAQNDLDVTRIIEAGKVGDKHYEMLGEVYKGLTTTSANELAKLDRYYKTMTNLLKSNATTTGASVAKVVGEQLTSNSNKYYTRNIIGKSLAQSQLTSGNRVTDATSLSWMTSDEIEEASKGNLKTQEEAKAAAESFSESIKTYLNTNQSAASDLNNLRKRLSANDEALTKAASNKNLIKSAMTSLTEDQLQNYIKSDREALEENTEGIAHRAFFTQAELEKQVGKSLEGIGDNTQSFDTWMIQWAEAHTKKSGLSLTDAMLELQKELDWYGESVDNLRAIYEQQEAATESAKSKARELHEVQFWEDMQHFATIDFPWYMREWERYYINHEAYNSVTADALQAAHDLQEEEKDQSKDAIDALAKGLEKNALYMSEMGDALKDPQLQLNTLVARILLVVEAIQQQNNDTSIVSVPLALSALGLGLTNSGSTNTSTSGTAKATSKSSTSPTSA